MGIFYAFLAALFTAIFQVLMKLLGKHGKNMWVNVAAYSFIAGGFTGIYALTEEPKYSLEISPIIFVVFAWLAWLITSGVNYMAVKRLQVSVNIILAQFALVITFIGAVIFFKDSVTLQKIIAVLMVVLATIIIFAQKGAFTRISKTGVIYRLIASTAFASAGLLDKYNINNYSIGIYMTLAYIVPAIVSLILGKTGLQGIITELRITWKYVLGLGVASAAAYYTTMMSFKLIEASLTFTIINFATVITVFIGVIFFKEREDLIRKLIALVIVVIAAILLNIS